jgi:polysaccharide export outer membrane protein
VTPGLGNTEQVEIIMTPRNSFFSMGGAALLWASGVFTLTAQEHQIRTAGAPPESALVSPANQQAGAQIVAHGSTIAADANAVNAGAGYQLRSGDVLELNFPFVPDFNQTMTVRPDGFITLHALGALRVEGMMIPDLTERLRIEYSSILRDPVVTVELKEFEKPYFIVAGEVERPGKYDLRGETTLTQAVAVAGGLKERAKHSQAVLFQRLPAGNFKATKLDLNKMLKDADLNADLRLQPGDLVFLPRRGNPLNLQNVTSLLSSLWMLTLLK